MALTPQQLVYLVVVVAAFGLLITERLRNDVVAGRFLLPALKGGDGASDRFRLHDYFTEVTLRPDSRLLDKTIDEVERDPRYDLRVMGVMRGGRRLGRELGTQRLGEGDVLLVRTSPDQLVNFREERGIELSPVGRRRRRLRGRTQAHDVVAGGPGGRGSHAAVPLRRLVRLHALSSPPRCGGSGWPPPRPGLHDQARRGLARIMTADPHGRRGGEAPRTPTE